MLSSDISGNLFYHKITIITKNNEQIQNDLLNIINNNSEEIKDESTLR